MIQKREAPRYIVRRRLEHESLGAWAEDDSSDDQSDDLTEEEESACAPTVPYRLSERPTVPLRRPSARTPLPIPGSTPRAPPPRVQMSSRERVATFYPTPLPLDTRRARPQELELEEDAPGYGTALLSAAILLSVAAVIGTAVMAAFVAGMP